MKSRAIFAACALLLLSAIALLLGPGLVEHATLAQSLSQAQQNQSNMSFLEHQQSPENCSVIYAADDQVALGGNNEDCLNPRASIWFLPPADGKYGLAIVGYENTWWAGAVNDHGLFFDTTGVHTVTIPAEEGKPIYEGEMWFKAMTECATVDCVLQLFDHYNRGPATTDSQYFFGDSTGNSAIIEPLTTIRKEGRYQVATNFLQSEIKPENRTDQRYNAAMGMFKQADHYSVDLMRDILNATHQETGAPTIYSTIYDLKQGLIYVYYFHDFNHVVTLNLRQELAKGVHAYNIASLFPPSADALASEKSIANYVSLRQAALGRVQVSPELLATYAGKYAVSPEQVFFFKSEGERLYIRTTWYPWIELIPVSNTHFAHVWADGLGQVYEIGMTFQTEAGKVTGLEFTDAAGNKGVIPRVGSLASATGEAQSPFASNWLWLLAALVLLVALPAGVIIWRRGLRRN